MGCDAPRLEDQGRSEYICSLFQYGWLKSEKCSVNVDENYCDMINALLGELDEPSQSKAGACWV